MRHEGDPARRGAGSDSMEQQVQGDAPSQAASDYVSEGSFDDLGLSEPVRRAIAERATRSRPRCSRRRTGPIRDGKDVIVRSKTGTGKTAAFGVPILERIPDGRRKALRARDVPRRASSRSRSRRSWPRSRKHKDLRVVTIYGGASMGDQKDKLEAGAEIVVGTPGRIYDFIRRKTLKLDEALVCCLDEADEMLNMGFFEEVTRILDHLPENCQQLLFSATVPADIEQIIREYLTTPETILLSGDEYKVENIHNVMYPAVDAYPKPRNLLYMIEIEEPEAAIVFCNTRDGHLARHGGAEPQRLRRRAAERRPAAEGARAGDGEGEARRGPLHGGDRHRRARHRHLRPLARHQLLAARGPGGLPAPRRPHRPHREEGHEPLHHLRRRHPHAHGAPEEVRDRVRGEEAADAGGGARASGPSGTSPS